MALGKVPKIYLGWAVVISIGVYGFVMARNSVSKNRVEIMRSRQRVLDQVQADQELKEAARKAV